MARRTRAAGVTVVLATAGLVVSIVAGTYSASPRLGPGPEVRGPVPGPRVVLAGRSAAAPATGPRRSEVGQRAARQQGRQSSARRPQRPPRPLWLSVPAVGIDAPVRPVGVAGDGQMLLPEDPAVLGWYRYGPAPTQPGSAVLAAHVDSREHGVGPLAWLREVEVGDALVVRTAQGPVPHVVTAIDRYAKQALPESVFTRTGPPRLRVVTCGGEFDEAAGSYRENLVVTAEPRG